MMLFFAEGRLGNQLFQYAFLQTIRQKNESILTSGLEEVQKYFNYDKYVNISREIRFTRVLMYEVLKRLLTVLAHWKIITTIKVAREVVSGLDRETGRVETREGLLRNLKYVELGYFQSQTFFVDRVVKRLKLKDEYQQTAKRFIESIPRNSYPVFVHIRRGDYRHFTMSGKSTYLPLSYYKECIKWFTQHKKNPYFIFLSDEPDTIETDFKEVNNKAISHHNTGVDLGIMRLCHGAILSPSSFSWWGSYFMLRRDIVFAPKYWLGFNFGVECHVGTTPSYVRTIRI